MTSKSTERQRTDRQSPARHKKPLPEIPDKLYYRIGEVARLCGVETYVLRFWETEFPQLKPNKSGTGQRLYRRREVELARRIRGLLYEDGYTIPGARQAIQVEIHKSDAHKGESRRTSEAADLPLARAGLKTGKEAPRLGRLRNELKEILGLLSTRPAGRSEAARKSKTEASAAGKRTADRPELFD